MVAIGIGGSLASSQIDGQALRSSERLGILLVFLVGSVLMIIADILVKSKRIDIISSLYFGILVGLFLTYIVGLALDPLFNNIVDTAGPEAWINPRIVQQVVMSFVGSRFVMRVSVFFGKPKTILDS